MSLNESRRNRRRERWPLEFDLEGVPQDTKHRRRLVEMKRRESEEEKLEETEMSNNSFTVDKMSAADREALLTALMRERPAGREIDLSKPVVGRYVHQEFPKMVYRHDTGHVIVVQDGREQAAAAKRGYVTEPSPSHDYSKLSGSNHAAVKAHVTREEEPMSAADLAALDTEDAQASSSEDPGSEVAENETPEAEAEVVETTEAEDRPSRRGRNR